MDWAGSSEEGVLTGRVDGAGSEGVLTALCIKLSSVSRNPVSSFTLFISVLRKFLVFSNPWPSLATVPVKLSESISAALLTCSSSVPKSDTTSRPRLRICSSDSWGNSSDRSSDLMLDRLLSSLDARADRKPSKRIISETTKCKRVVFPSFPFTSDSFRSVSSLKACAPPRYVPEFMRLPVFRTASRSLRNSLLFRSLPQAAWIKGQATVKPEIFPRNKYKMN
nr:hypothetical protein Ahy_A04g017913 isoform B [Ipomoea batatas]